MVSLKIFSELGSLRVNGAMRTDTMLTGSGTFCWISGSRPLPKQSNGRGRRQVFEKQDGRQGGRCEWAVVNAEALGLALDAGVLSVEGRPLKMSENRSLGLGSGSY
jgi:hypothetical protein